MSGSTLFTLALLMLFLLCPIFARFDGYQSRLWTSETADIYHEDSTWHFNNGRRARGIVTWNRLRLGFPTQPVTIDWHPETGALQATVEPGFIYVNLICFSFIYGIGLALRLIAKRFAGRHPEPDEY